MPQFKNPDQARDYLIMAFKEIITKMENAKTPEDKIKIMKEFDMTQFTAEDQLLNGKKVVEYQEYQNAKSLVYDFFNWIETQKGINIFKASHEEPFFNEMHGNKTLMVAMLIQVLNVLPQELQAYFILNIFRTTYELNFKNITLILNAHLKKQNKKTNDFYYIDTIKTEFGDYPKIDELIKYFKNDIRNPVAHENWFVKDGWVWTKNKGQEEKQDMLEISKEIYNLFYFRVALSTYLLEKYKDFAKNKDITSEQVSKFIESIKNKLNELEKDKKEPIKDNGEITPQQLFDDINRIKKTGDTRLLILFLHLYAEHFINKIALEKRVKGKIREKVKNLISQKIIDDDIYEIWDLLYDLRNRLVHDLRPDQKLLKRWIEDFKMPFRASRTDGADKIFLENLKQYSPWDRVQVYCIPAIINLFKKLKELRKEKLDYDIQIEWNTAMNLIGFKFVKIEENEN